MTDEIVLTLPRERRFYDVAHLVVSGLGARLNLTMDNLADLQLALDGLLPRRETGGESRSSSGSTTSCSTGRSAPSIPRRWPSSSASAETAMGYRSC